MVVSGLVCGCDVVVVTVFVVAVQGLRSARRPFYFYTNLKGKFEHFLWLLCLLLFLLPMDMSASRPP